MLFTINNLRTTTQMCVLASWQMKKTDLIREVARTRGLDTGNAADKLDRAVNQVIRALRQGRPAHQPGVGTITPGRTGKAWIFMPERHDN